MADDDKKSFFATLPGLLTGIAALIGALTTLYITCNNRNAKTVQQIDSATDKQAASQSKIDSAKIVSNITPKDTSKVRLSPMAAASNNKDEFKILSILPSLNTVLQGQSPFAINMKIHYDLESSDSAFLVVGLVRYADGDPCGSENGETIAGATPPMVKIKHGEGDLFVNIMYDPGRNGQKKGSSFTGNHVAPHGTLWAGFDSQNRVIVLQGGLWDYKDFCYTFQP